LLPAASECSRSASPVAQPEHSGSLPSTQTPGHKDAPFRDGYSSGGRAKAADYAEPVQSLLLTTMKDYSCRIWTYNPFPDAEDQDTWTHEAWTKASEGGDVTYNLSTRMLRLVRASQCFYISSWHCSVSRLWSVDPRLGGHSKTLFAA
jgi:hypothetical protein